MGDRHHHRQDDIMLVAAALEGDVMQLPVLVTWGARLRADLAASLREVMATRAWQQELAAATAGAVWQGEPSFSGFFERELGSPGHGTPEYQQVHAALLTFPEVRVALYRLWRGHCPQHCCSEAGDLNRERHLEDFRQALHGWRAVTASIGRILADALQRHAHGHEHRGTLTTLLARGPRQVHDANATPLHRPELDDLRELLVMLYATTPDLLHLTGEALTRAAMLGTGERSAYAAAPAGTRDELTPWGEPGQHRVGGIDAARLARLLTEAVSVDEQRILSKLVSELIAEAIWERDHELAHQTIPHPCTSDKHQAPHEQPDAREACAKARACLYQMTAKRARATQPGSGEWRPRPELLLGSRRERLDHALRLAQVDVPADLPQAAPTLWRRNTDALRQAREDSGVHEYQAAELLGIQPATLRRWERPSGARLPGAGVALRYLLLIALASAQVSKPIPRCLPSSVAKVGTTLVAMR